MERQLPSTHMCKRGLGQNPVSYRVSFCHVGVVVEDEAAVDDDGGCKDGAPVVHGGGGPKRNSATANLLLPSSRRRIKQELRRRTLRLGLLSSRGSFDSPAVVVAVCVVVVVEGVAPSGCKGAVPGGSLSAG